MSETVPLGDLVSITRGTTYKSARLGEPGPVLLGLASIARNGGFRSDSLKTYGGETPEKLLVRPGEMYASLKDVTQSADLLGSVARVPVDGRVGRLTQDTVRLDVMSKAVEPSYLYLSLLTPEYREYCRSHSTGTTNLGLPREDFLAYPVLLPSLNEQQRIAGVLGALNDLIETNRVHADRLNELAKAASTRFISSVADRTTVPLSRFCSATKGFSYKSTELADGADILVNLKNIGRGGIFQRRGFKRLNSERYKEAQVVIPGDIVVSMTDLTQNRDVVARPVRVPAVHTPGRMVASLDLSIVRPKNGYSREFLAAALAQEDFHTFALGYCNGTTVVHLSGRVFDDYELPDVTPEETVEIAAVLSALNMQADACTSEIDELIAVRDKLLPLLISGRVRVREVA